MISGRPSPTFGFSSFASPNCHTAVPMSDEDGCGGTVITTSADFVIDVYFGFAPFNSPLGCIACRLGANH